MKICFSFHSLSVSCVLTVWPKHAFVVFTVKLVVISTFFVGGNKKTKKARTGVVFVTAARIGMPSSAWALEGLRGLNSKLTPKPQSRKEPVGYKRNNVKLIVDFFLLGSIVSLL
jgi:hypothetical protein